LSFPLLFTSPYSYPLHFLSFSCAAIHCSPLQLPFLFLLIHSSHYICLPLLSFPNQSPHFLSFLNIHHLLTRLHTNHTYPLSPAITDKSTLHYKSGNTHKHTQGPLYPAAPIALLVPPFSITFTNYPSFTYSQINNIPPTPTFYNYYH
jgi:hypothetical protein